MGHVSAWRGCGARGDGLEVEEARREGYVRCGSSIQHNLERRCAVLLHASLRWLAAALRLPMPASSAWPSVARALQGPQPEPGTRCAVHRTRHNLSSQLPFKNWCFKNYAFTQRSKWVTLNSQVAARDSLSAKCHGDKGCWHISVAIAICRHLQKGRSSLKTRPASRPRRVCGRAQALGWWPRPGFRAMGL